MGKLAEVKTKVTDLSVEDFINSITPEQKRQDSEVILKMMQKASKEKPKLWSTMMIGFGNIIVKSPTSGREVAWLKIGFAPRKANLTLYLSINIKAHQEILDRLGKHKTGGGCLYINKLADVDLKVLEELIKASLKNFS